MNVRKKLNMLFRRGSFRGNVAMTVATNVLIGGMTLVTGTLAARLLHPAGRGQLAAIQVLPAVVGTLATLGLWEAVVYVSSSRPSESGRALASAVTVTLAVSPVFWLASYFLMPRLLSAQTVQVVAAARWYLFLIPIFSILYIPLHLLRANPDLLAWNLVRVLPVLGWLIVLILAWYTGHPNPVWISGAHLVCLAALVAPMWLIALRKISPPFKADWNLAREMLRYGLPSAAGAIPQNLNLKLDQMLMSALFPPQYLGLYVVAVAWSSVVGPIMSAIAQPLLPKVASHKTTAERVRFLTQVLRIAVAVSALLVLGLGFATPFFISKLFGSEYAAAIPCAVVLVIAAGFSGINYVLQEGVRGLADTPAVFFGEGAGLISTVLSLLVLLPRLGILGAAIASLLGYSTTAAFLLVRLRLRTGASVGSLLFARVDDIRLIVQRVMPGQSEVLTDTQEMMS